ncbi:MAG TPA: hypothetical protein VKQ36_13155, partial [Ktedonobacterales bacterium]|nr:hypothetical protein [Ktedonobacterales bacterium]
CSAGVMRSRLPNDFQGEGSLLEYLALCSNEQSMRRQHSCAYSAESQTPQTEWEVVAAPLSYSPGYFEYMQSSDPKVGSMQSKKERLVNRA